MSYVFELGGLLPHAIFGVIFGPGGRREGPRSGAGARRSATFGYFGLFLGGGAGVPRGGPASGDPPGTGPVSPSGSGAELRPFFPAAVGRLPPGGALRTAGSGAPGRTHGYRSRLERSLLA